MISKQKIFGLLLVILSFCALMLIVRLFSEKTTVPATSSHNQTKQPQTPVPEIVKQLYTAEIPRELDPKNEKVSLKDGKIEIRGPEILADGTQSDEYTDVFYWGAYLISKPNAYVIADANNDGSDDIATVIGTTGGGSGFFYYLALFLSENGQLKLKTSQYLGDRIKINTIGYKDGIFSADVITQGPNEGYCCGTLQKVFKYKYLNGVFTDVAS